LIHFFKQKKPFLQDLIPDNYIDIHSHLLPGIDDGASTIEDTTTLINGLEEIGFKKFITTPHVMGDVWPNTSNQINEKMGSTIAELKVHNIGNRFKAAAEYMIDAEFRELFKNEPLLSLKENMILVEMSYLNPPIQLKDILFELQVAGYQPLLAHPERYNFYHHPSLEDYKKLKKAGCLFQLNMLSTTGYYGERVAKTADLLIKNGLIDFIGSDIHHTRHLEAMHKKVVLKNYEYLTPIFQNNSFFDF
jgi:tyrosine-protein phosphatase YwqE